MRGPLCCAALLALGCGARTGLITEERGTDACRAAWRMELPSVDPRFATAALLDLAVLPDGDLVLLGRFSGGLDLGGQVLSSSPTSWLDTFIVRTSRSGAVRWSRQIAGKDDGIFEGSVLLDPDGTLLIVVSTRDPIDFGGGILPPIGLEDLVVARLDSNGNHLRSRRLGAPDNAIEPRGAATGPGGRLVIVGSTSACCGQLGSIDLGGGALDGTADNFDTFALELDRDLEHVWSRRSVAPVLDTADSVTVTPAGEAILAGRSFGNFSMANLTAPISGEGAFVMELDTGGNALWTVPESSTYEGGTQTQLLDIRAHADASVSACGAWAADHTWTAQPLPTPDGSAHAVLVRLDPDGNHRWSRYVRLDPALFGVGDEAPFEHLAILPDDGLLVTGSAESGFAGLDDFDASIEQASAPYMARLDADGRLECGLLLDARYSTAGLRIVAAGRDEAVVAGSLGSAESNTHGIFVVGVDTSR